MPAGRAPCQQAGRHGSHWAPARAAPGGRHRQQQAGRPGAIGHGPCWGTSTSTSTSATPGASARPAGRRHGSRRAPARAVPGERHRQQQVSRPAPCQQAGRHGSRRAPARAVPGERHQQQQAGAIGHAGRHRPWAIGHGPWAMGHGPWAMLGHWHQHQQQAGTIGQRLVDGTDSSRPAGQQAGRHGSGRGPWITLARQTGSPGRSKPGARGAPGETLLAPNSGTTRRRCKALPQGKSRRERARNQAKKSMYV